MRPTLALPPLTDAASLLTCLVDLVWGRPLGDIECTAVFQVLHCAVVNGELVDLQRPAPMLLTVVPNVVRHLGRECCQVVGGNMLLISKYKIANQSLRLKAAGVHGLRPRPQPLPE